MHVDLYNIVTAVVWFSEHFLCVYVVVSKQKTPTEKADARSRYIVKDAATW